MPEWASALIEEQLRGVLDAHGFPTNNTVGSALLELALPAIRLSTRRIPPGSLGVAASKFFGRPDLPASTPWPMHGDEPLIFVCQINLGDVAAYDQQHVLPTSGLLSFFCYLEEPGQGHYELAADGTGQTIFHADPRSSVRPRDLPLIVPRFQECALDAQLEPTLPPWESPQMDTVGIDRDAYREYSEVVTSLAEPYGGLQPPVHRLLGYPQQQQGALQRSCPGDNWQLLLQVDTDPLTDAMWGDVGMLYFMIAAADLTRGVFNATYLVEQCG